MRAPLSSREQEDPSEEVISDLRPKGRKEAHWAKCLLSSQAVPSAWSTILSASLCQTPTHCSRSGWAGTSSGGGRWTGDFLDPTESLSFNPPPTQLSSLSSLFLEQTLVTGRLHLDQQHHPPAKDDSPERLGALPKESSRCRGGICTGDLFTRCVLPIVYLPSLDQNHRG